jgi:hypothetical protein
MPETNGGLKANESKFSIGISGVPVLGKKMRLNPTHFSYGSKEALSEDILNYVSQPTIKTSKRYEFNPDLNKNAYAQEMEKLQR